MSGMLVARSTSLKSLPVEFVIVAYTYVVVGRFCNIFIDTMVSMYWWPKCTYWNVSTSAINIINPFGKWWKACRLINIAQTGNHHGRLKVVRKLAWIDHLKFLNVRHLAQMFSGADTLWFWPINMKECIKDPTTVLSDLLIYWPKWNHVILL